MSQQLGSVTRAHLDLSYIFALVVQRVVNTIKSDVGCVDMLGILTMVPLLASHLQF